MSLGLQISAHIHNTKLHESIQFLDRYYFYYCNAKAMQELMEMMEGTGQYKILSSEYSPNNDKSLATRSIVRYMLDKLLTPDRSECILPLLILAMLRGESRSISVNRLMEDMRLWLNEAHTLGWLSQQEYKAIVSRKLVVQHPDFGRVPLP